MSSAVRFAPVVKRRSIFVEPTVGSNTPGLTASSILNELRSGLAEQSLAGMLAQGLTLEQFICDPRLGNHPASAPQRALIRAIEGRALDGVLTSDRAQFHFGCDARLIGREKPNTVVMRKGVRAGGSLIAILAAYFFALSCDCTNLRPGDRVRIPIVAPVLRLTRAAFAHLVGTLSTSEILRKTLVGTPGVEHLRFRRPDGRIVDVELVAAATAGLNLRSDWFAGIVLDEADFHDDADAGAAVNLDDNLSASRPRMLPGSRAFVVSSPHAEGTEFDKFHAQAWGKPSDVLAFHSDTRSMNPTFPQATIDAERKRFPEKAAREFDAIPLQSGSRLFFSAEQIKRSVVHGREDILAPNDQKHSAGCDLAWRKNSSALAIARSKNSTVVELAYLEENKPEPQMPLRPGETCKAYGEVAQHYGCASVMGDLFGADAAEEAFRKLDGPSISYECWTPTTENWSQAFADFRELMDEGRLELPENERLLSQLRLVAWRPAPGGRIQIVLPKKGNAHCDLLVAVVLACVQVRQDIAIVPWNAAYDDDLPQGRC